MHHTSSLRSSIIYRLPPLVMILLLLAACTLPFQRQAATPAPNVTAQPTATTRPAATTKPKATQAPDQPTNTVQASAATPAPEALQTDDASALIADTPPLRDALELAQDFKGTGRLPRVARDTPLDVKLGDIEKFWVTNITTNENYQIEATLRYIGPVALMYVDNTLKVDQADIERSAKEFEQRIYPRDRAIFGKELSPGIDGDTRLTILNTNVDGAGGYFSSGDGVVKGANRFSNERDMFVIAQDSYPLGSEGYASTLAHEFQHMIHENEQPQSASWFNEGMSTLAEDLNGYGDSYTTLMYLGETDLPLTDWRSVGQHYGMSQLFMRYFYEQYAGEKGLAGLITANAGVYLDSFATMAAQKRSDIKSFDQIFADWAVANLINDPHVGDGRFAYKLLPHTVGTTDLEPGTHKADISQYGIDYIGLPAGSSLTFDGSSKVPLVGSLPKDGKYAWWSGRFDQTMASMTRELDLTAVQKATLKFATHYEIELNYDYAFVSVSTDGGETWKNLEATTSTSDDPQDANYGFGLTGVSGSPGKDIDDAPGKWIEEEADLTPYAGQRVLLRFWMITDAAVNGSNILIDNIRIPEINFQDSAEQGDNGWQTAGFERVYGLLPQHWELRLVRMGNETSVEPVAVDANGHAELQLQKGERAVLVVMATTRLSSDKATYTVTIKR